MDDDADLPVITFFRDFKDEYLDFEASNGDNLNITDEDEEEGVVYLTFNNETNETADEEAEESQSLLLQDNGQEPLVYDDNSTVINSDLKLVASKIVTFGDQQYYCIPIVNEENLLNDDESLETSIQQPESSELTFINEPLDILIRNDGGTLVSATENLEPFEMIITHSTEEEESNEQEPKNEFKCLYKGCEKRYATSNHLSHHLRQHSKGKTYACPYEGCGKKFATSYSLTAHGRTHTGEKPYVCPDCVKSFKTSGDLVKHKRTHTGEKPFKCPIKGCDKAFTTSNIRKVHVRSHTGERPYVCDYPNCGKAFAASTNYKNHARIHSGEKPYVCSVEGCNKKFTEYSSLFKHQAVHKTPDKSFECVYCKAKLKSQHILNIHIRIKHSIVPKGTGIKVLNLESIGLTIKKESS